jgi:hypothetical protein
MSAWGQKLTFRGRVVMSPFPKQADINQRVLNVGDGPISDIGERADGAAGQAEWQTECAEAYVAADRPDNIRASVRSCHTNAWMMAAATCRTISEAREIADTTWMVWAIRYVIKSGNKG